MGVDVSDAAEQYRSEHYQRTVEIERRFEDGITADECYQREAGFALEASGIQLLPGDRVLDLCCGIGAHSHIIREQTGADIDAFDLANKAIATASLREAVLQAEEKVRGKITFALGDMGNILEKVPSEQKYKLITILGNSFIYLPNKAAYQKALEDYYSLLEPGGKLVLEFRPPNHSGPRKELHGHLGVVNEPHVKGSNESLGTKISSGHPFFIMRDRQVGDGVYYYMESPPLPPGGYLDRFGDSVCVVDGEGRRLVTDFDKDTNCIFSYIDADGLNHSRFGRVYVQSDGTEEGLGTADVIDFRDSETNDFPSVVPLLQSVGFKNVRQERKPLSAEGVHDMVMVVAEK